MQATSILLSNSKLVLASSINNKIKKLIVCWFAWVAGLNQEHLSSQEWKVQDMITETHLLLFHWETVLVQGNREIFFLNRLTFPLVWKLSHYVMRHRNFPMKENMWEVLVLRIYFSILNKIIPSTQSTIHHYGCFHGFELHNYY